MSSAVLLLLTSRLVVGVKVGPHSILTDYRDALNGLRGCADGVLLQASWRGLY